MNNNSPRIPDFSSGNFDFDSWQRLAQKNPRGYFDARRAAIAAFIAAHPRSAMQLHALQERIDATRATACNPLSATRQLSAMMHENVELLGHQLEVLQRETDRLRSRLAASSTSIRKQKDR